MVMTVNLAPFLDVARCFWLGRLDTPMLTVNDFSGIAAAERLLQRPKGLKKKTRGKNFRTKHEQRKGQEGLPVQAGRVQQGMEASLVRV